MQAAVSTYLKFVPFQNFNLWDVKRYYNQTTLNFENVIALSDLLIPYKQSVSKEEMIKNEWQIISKINFGGELFLRDFEEINTYKGNLNLVPDNAIIYSKINVRHGCIYYHDKRKIPFGVSSEYPTYTFDETKVNGKFLHKLLRSEAFKKLLNTKTTGISKARVKQDEFLRTQIPLPSLKEQDILMKNYFAKIAEAENLNKQASDLEGEIERYFLEQLEIFKSNEIRFKKGLNIISYASLTKWSFNHINKNEQFDFDKSKYKSEKIKNLLTFFEGGKTPSKSNSEFWKREIYWTSPKDFIKEDLLKTAQDKISKTALKEAGMKLYPKGTILSVFRSGILQHSFPTVITNIETTINQDLKAYSFIEEKINNHYYLTFTQVFKQYILSKASKKSVTVESINTKDFLDLPIPLPPLPKQHEIVAHVQKLKENIKEQKTKAIQLKTQAEQEFEKPIFS